MKRNNIHLNGLVDSCKLVVDESGKEMAAIRFRTIHPRLDVPDTAKASERFEPFFHKVMVPVVASNREELVALVGQQDGSSLRPYDIDGVLSFHGGDAVVICPPGGMVRAEKVKTADNNVVSLAGRIRSVSAPGKFASLLVHTKEGDVRVIVSKDVNEAGWRMVSEGRIKKGDSVSLSGPLRTRMYTDGKSDMRSCSISARTLTELKLVKDVRQKTGGPSL